MSVHSYIARYLVYDSLSIGLSSSMLSCELSACEERAFTLRRAWLGALAACSMCVGRPIRLWVSPFGDISLALFLMIVQPSVGCSWVCILAVPSRIRIVCARPATRLRWISSWYFWKVLHSRLCHALWPLPQLAQETPFFGHSLCWCGPAHIAHFACFTQAA